jgi:hypothetical protein
MSIHIFLPLYIDGVEVTQAIQYYHAKDHLTDPADRGEDNSVRLIANKPAWVRVYVRSRLTTSISGVSGTLEVQQRRLASLYETVFTPSADLPGTLTAEINPNYADERGNLGSSLNFRIPAEYMIGHMRLKVKIIAGSLSDESDVYLDVTLRQTLRLAGIMISYAGPLVRDDTVISEHISLAAPTVTDLQQTAPLTIRLMPVESNATYRIAGTIPWDKPLIGTVKNEGGCPDNFYDLNVEVRAAIDKDGNLPDWTYYGLYPQDMPRGSKVSGCSTEAASGPSQAQGTMAHELGHYHDLPHAPCGFKVNPDPTYPAYEPYDSVPLLGPGSGSGTVSIPHGILGEYALNVNDGTIVPPNFFDLMSYCSSVCFGLYNYGRLMFKQRLNPTIINDTPWWFDFVLMTDPFYPPKLWLPDPPLSDPLHFSGININAKSKANRQPLISVIGLVHSDTDIEVRSVIRLSASNELSGGKETEFVIDLLDKDGKILSTTPVYQVPSYGRCNCCSKDNDNPIRPPYVFQAYLEDVPAGAQIRISRQGKQVWVRHAPSEPVRIQSFGASVSKDKLVIVNWDIKSSADQKPDVWLQWSEDKGKTWHGLSTGLTGKTAKLDISLLSPGLIYLRLLASDGFYTTASDPVSVNIPTRSPSVVILYPPNNIELRINSMMRLWGVCTYSSGKPADPESVAWIIDDKEVGRGLDVFVTAPPEGKHRCTLKVVVNRKTIEQTIEFKTVASLKR